MTAKNFANEVLESKIPVLVDFWAPWCMPCRFLEPILSEVAKEYEGKLKVGKLNVDENPEIAMAYQVTSIPNLKIFKNGRLVDEIGGVVPKATIIKRLKKHL